MDAVRHSRTTHGMENRGVAQALKAMREKAGLSVRAVAEALDRPASTYASYEDKFKKPFLPVDLARALIPIFEPKGISRHEILALAGLDMEPPPRRPAPSPPADEIDTRSLPRNLPILGSGAAGEDGMFEFNGQTLDYVRRPPRIAAVRDAYALYVTGESMTPWREHGDLVIVHPHQPVRVNDYVVVQLKPSTPDGIPPGYIKRLIRRTEQELRLRQYNPPKDLVVPMKKVATVHRVMDWSELMGL